MKDCKFCTQPATYRVENLYTPIRACHRHLDQAQENARQTNPEVTPLKTSTSKLKTVNNNIFTIRQENGITKAYVDGGLGYVNLETGQVEKELSHPTIEFDVATENGDTVVYAKTMFKWEEALRLTPPPER